MTTVTPTITHRKVKVKFNFERYAYLFMRMSGLVLLILAVGHMVIQHVLNSSGNLTLIFVAEQWNSWGWKAYDIFLLLFAIPHGINGLRNVLADYIHNPGTMKVINIVLAIFVVATVIWAAIGISLFDPEAARQAAQGLPG
ncbi:MAG: succinate dehydrogenase [Anaerolineae bacterium]|jgi:succinate dehydrogenase / fumarate reductase membrane anchor subunit|nr:succinate dehydrogenase [Anaerolineae bacterium]